MTELLATASQRHVVPLQGRPYEEDQVTGMLTVEFLFTEAGVSHAEARTVVNRPVGSIMKQPSAFQDEEPNDNLFQSDNTKKGFSPYFDYSHQESFDYSHQVDFDHNQVNLINVFVKVCFQTN